MTPRDLGFLTKILTPRTIILLPFTETFQLSRVRTLRPEDLRLDQDTHQSRDPLEPTPRKEIRNQRCRYSTSPTWSTRNFQGKPKVFVLNVVNVKRNQSSVPCNLRYTLGLRFDSLYDPSTSSKQFAIPHRRQSPPLCHRDQCLLTPPVTNCETTISPGEIFLTVERLYKQLKVIDLITDRG